ncbi:MAG: alpha/beta hydrolase [Candidatus Nanoarchaeia archaeon]|jgi:pimeloyl-ACP methyl ester carboxylesterase
MNRKELIDSNGFRVKLNIHNPSARKTVIFSHGFLSNKNKYFLQSTAKVMARRGYRCVRFNYKTEDISDRLLILDAVLNHISKSSDSVGLVGSSLGGMVSLITAVKPIIKSLVLLNPVYYQDKVYRNYVAHHSLLKRLFNKKVGLEFFKYDLQSIVKRLNKPVLIITGGKDDIVDYRTMNGLYNDLKGEKRLVVLDDCGHSIWRPDHVRITRREIIDWFRKTL